MRILISFALAAAFSGSASAQTVTKCSEFMGDVECRTSAPAPAISWRDVPPRPCNKLDKLAYNGSLYCEAREVASNRKAVGDLIAAGKCDEALKAALGTGDLQFAGEVRDFCKK